MIRKTLESLIVSSSNRDKYRELCRIETTIPLTSMDWWLDVVCGADLWDVILIEKNGEIVCSMPYQKKMRLGLTYITMPLLTKTLGPWIKYPEGQKLVSKLSYEDEIFTVLIDKLPKFDYFNQNFHSSITNWLPFYWRDYQQTTKFTYVIEDLTNLDRVFANFKQNTRTEIRKAMKQIDVVCSNDVEMFYSINKKSFDRQAVSIPYSFVFFTQLDAECAKRNCRKMFFAKDKDNNIHAVWYIVWDKNSAKSLFSGADPKLRNSGATSLLIWEAIRHASVVTQRFDFDGSMMQSVEPLLRTFGGTQKQFFNISKTNSKILKLKSFLREVLK